MFVVVLSTVLFFTIAVGGETITGKPRPARPYAIFPVPFDLPNRNDRSDQCWLRVEDFEIVETISVYCFVAHAFLRSYIHDYNLRKMQEDDVGVNDVSKWNEVRRTDTEVKAVDKPNTVKDWKTTTLFDPTVNRRIYVTKMAECKLIMYSREGMTNYSVNCERILNFVNNYTSHAIKNCNVNILTLYLFFIILLFIV